MQRTVIVFGHTSGLGHEISETLLKQGHHVVGVARSCVATSSPGLVEISADLANEIALNNVIETIRSQHASFDAVVYCAGVLTAHDIDAVSYDTMTYLYRLNLFAPMLIESRLLDLIEQNGADVVNVTSSSIMEYYPKFTEYSTAKAAFAKFTDDLRRQLQPSSARVIDLCPSGFSSNMYVNMSGDKIDRDESKQMQAADLAALVAYVLQLPKIIEVAHLYVNRK